MIMTDRKLAQLREQINRQLADGLLLMQQPKADRQQSACMGRQESQKLMRAQIARQMMNKRPAKARRDQSRTSTT